MSGRAVRVPERQVESVRYPTGDIVVVSGLPGSGKSTLMRRAAPAYLIDSQHARDRWADRVGARLPYAIYRPLVRIDHYAGLWRVIRSGGSVVVHDCGSLPWVRRWLAREARRRGRGLHLVLLDVPPEAALAGQAERGRRVSRYAFARHRRSASRLVEAARGGRLEHDCSSVLVLDRASAGALRSISFGSSPRPAQPSR